MYPFAVGAGAIALFLMVAALQRPRPAGIVAAILWAGYAVYEYFVANGTLCDAKCNIRVDLVMAWPLLAFATWYACSTPGKRSVFYIVFGAFAVVVLLLLVAPLAFIPLLGLPEMTQPAPGAQPQPK